MLARARDRSSRRAVGTRADALPYVTIALVAISCAVWVALRSGYLDLGKLVIVGPLGGDWWKLFSTQFVYLNGLVRVHHAARDRDLRLAAGAPPWAGR